MLSLNSVLSHTVRHTTPEAVHGAPLFFFLQIDFFILYYIRIKVVYLVGNAWKFLDWTRECRWLTEKLFWKIVYNDHSQSVCSKLGQMKVARKNWDLVEDIKGFPCCASWLRCASKIYVSLEKKTDPYKQTNKKGCRYSCHLTLGLILIKQPKFKAKWSYLGIPAGDLLPPSGAVGKWRFLILLVWFCLIMSQHWHDLLTRRCFAIV